METKLTEIILTESKLSRIQRDAVILNEYNILIGIDGAMPTAVRLYLAKKYFLSETTIWKITKQQTKTSKTNKL